MILKVFTLPNCPRCPSAKAVAEAVVKQRRDITLEVLDLSNQDNMLTALMLQIVSAPSFIIDNTPVVVDDVPSEEELNRKINEYIQKFKS